MYMKKIFYFSLFLSLLGNIVMYFGGSIENLKLFIIWFLASFVLWFLIFLFLKKVLKIEFL